MSILFFGTYDELTHPRVRVLREGLEAHGRVVEVVNAPLDFGTAQRVRLASRPWTAPAFLLRVASRWTTLWRQGRGRRPDVVVVGYLGHLDVHLARRRFPKATIVLDHMVGLADTVRDRELADGWVARTLGRVDRAALRAAHIVLVDTEEQAATLPHDLRARAVVVPVGAPSAWFSPAPSAPPGPLRVVFFGLFTPLQGAPTIGRALSSIPDADLTCTMIGDGQDLVTTKGAVGDDERVTWTPWIDARELISVVASHDVCLGIFGDSAKAQRVVPNKVFQGAAAGCALVTSDTPPQRRLLGDAAVLVPAADADALATALERLAEDPQVLDDLRARAGELAARQFTPGAVVTPLLDRLATR